MNETIMGIYIRGNLNKGKDSTIFRLSDGDN